MTARSSRFESRGGLLFAHLFSLFVLALLFGLVLVCARSVSAQTVWSGPTLSFTKADGADPTLPANQDLLIPGVAAITRGNNRGIYNAAVESFYLNGVSPTDTEWAWVLNNPAVAESQIRAANHAMLDFAPWAVAHGNQPLATVGRPGVLHILSEDVYVDIRFTSWSSLASGGGFSWDRSTPAAPVPGLSSNGRVGLLGALVALVLSDGLRRVRLRA